MKELRQSVVDFEIIEESDDWIAVAKPAPLIVHPTDLKGQPTLLGGLEALLSFDIANGARLSIITRLDRETSGVVLVAKRKSTARAFCRAMERRLVKKSYLAVVYGVPSWKSIEVCEPLTNVRDFSTSKVWLKQGVHSSGKESLTRFTVKQVFGNFTLLEAKPLTGRMHQIRVHAACIGFPLVGDKIYGVSEEHYLNFIELGWTDEMEQQLLLKRQALHASCLEIELGGEFLKLRAPLAKDLQYFLDENS